MGPYTNLLLRSTALVGNTRARQCLLGREAVTMPSCWRRSKRMLFCRATEQVYIEEATSAGPNGAAQPGLIFRQGQVGAWDAGGVGNPVVRYYVGDDEQRWYMWYNGHTREAAGKSALHAACIGLATSEDGVRWLRGGGDIEGQKGPGQLSDVGRVLGPNGDWWWHDTRHVSVSDVQIFSSTAINTGIGVYWMFYTGGCFEEAMVPSGMPDLPQGQELEGLRTRIGLAMSQDGRNWARIEANHHTGALFDAGEEGDWDEAFIGCPQVLSLGPKDMRMYYHSFNKGRRKWVVGAASSRDGFNWKKTGPVFEGGQESEFDAFGAAAHQVVRDPEHNRFVMFYEAVAADNSRTISVAVSKDGLKGWKRLGKPVLSAGAEGMWDSGGVGSPCAVSMADGKWRLYYGGRQRNRGPWQGIGLAITDAGSLDALEGFSVGFKRRTPRL